MAAPMVYTKTQGRTNGREHPSPTGADYRGDGGNEARVDIQVG